MGRVGITSVFLHKGREHYSKEQYSLFICGRFVQRVGPMFNSLGHFEIQRIKELVNDDRSGNKLRIPSPR